MLDKAQTLESIRAHLEWNSRQLQTFDLLWTAGHREVSVFMADCGTRRTETTLLVAATRLWRTVTPRQAQDAAAYLGDSATARILRTGLSSASMESLVSLVEAADAAKLATAL